LVYPYACSLIYAYSIPPAFQSPLVASCSHRNEIERISNYMAATVAEHIVGITIIMGRRTVADMENAVRQIAFITAAIVMVHI